MKIYICLLKIYKYFINKYLNLYIKKMKLKIIKINEWSRHQRLFEENV